MYDPSISIKSGSLFSLLFLEGTGALLVGFIVSLREGHSDMNCIVELRPQQIGMWKLLYMSSASGLGYSIRILFMLTITIALIDGANFVIYSLRGLN